MIFTHPSDSYTIAVDCLFRDLHVFLESWLLFYNTYGILRDSTNCVAVSSCLLARSARLVLSAANQLFRSRLHTQPLSIVSAIIDFLSRDSDVDFTK